MLKIKPENSSKFRTVMDALHRVYETREATVGNIPETWGLADPMVRKNSFLVETGDLVGIVYDMHFPHTRKTLKERHEWENFEWTSM